MIAFEIIAIALFVSIRAVHPHSWVECTDYNLPSFEYSDLGNYDRARCSGYPRRFARQYAAGFGAETGYNWEHPDCSRDHYNAGDYTSQIRMAVYQPGQTIYISHPSKNHVADTCTDPFVPSMSMELLVSSQVNVDTFDLALAMKGGDHVNGRIDHLGYQRCFNFCGDKDKAHCVTGWTLPNHLAEGRHSFHWRWQFNSQQSYSSCFDAYISAPGSTITPSISPPSSSPSSSSSDDSLVDSGSGSDSSSGSMSSYSSSMSSSSSGSSTSGSYSGSSSSSSMSSGGFYDTSAPSPAKSTPALTPARSTPTPTPAKSTSQPDPVPPTVASSTPSPTPEVISSASSLTGPLDFVKSYFLNFTGNINGRFNVTPIAS